MSRMRLPLGKGEVHRRQRTQSGILTEAEVARIKWFLLQGESKRQLAEIYGMSLWAIRAISRGETWTWVEPDQGPGGNGAVAEAQAVTVAQAEIAASQARIMKSLRMEAVVVAPPVSDRSESWDEGDALAASEPMGSGLDKFQQEIEKIAPGAEARAEAKLKDFLGEG